MTPHRLDPVLRHVRDVGGPPADDQPDAALLAAFARTRDKTAFAVLVRRYGPMVLGVCRRLLGDLHTADDTFQATFLLLATKARHLRDPNRLGPWLYGVARRVALKARAAVSRRREVATVDVPAPKAGDPMDLRPILDAAIAALPTRYREPVVLCYLQGLTNIEAAEQLHCPLGTVATRLSRARDRLRVLLTRQGVVPSAAALAGALTPEATAAAVSDDLLRTATRWAAALAAGPAAAAVVPTHILTLTKQVAQTMILDKLKVMAVLVAFGAIGAGVALSRQTGREPPAKDDPPPPVANNGTAPRGEQPLPLAQLRQKAPDAYRIDAGEVLGVFIEGVLGQRGEVPPVLATAMQAGGPARAPAIGYPFPVNQDGTVSLPLQELIDVRGLTATEAQAKVLKTYLDRHIVKPGTRVIVNVAMPRTYRVTLVRRDSSGVTRSISAVDLDAYENDVLSLLAKSGGAAR
jgi:RNA polymerase sigma factor (sigma-70 family)